MGLQAEPKGPTSKPKPQIIYKNVLLELKERLRNTYLENLSFEAIIDKYDRENTFFFVDPPYFETTGIEMILEKKSIYYLKTR